jgi:hypothetical protein
MRAKKNLGSEELDELIAQLIERRTLMEKRLAELETALIVINKKLKSLYAKRTIALNFTLPLGDVSQ